MLDTHTHTCANTCIGKHTHIHDTHTHDTHTHKHSHARAHTHTHTHAHTHTHTHTHSCKHSQSKEKYEMFGHAQYLSKKSRSFVPALSSRFFWASVNGETKNREFKNRGFNKCKWA